MVQFNSLLLLGASALVVADVGPRTTTHGTWVRELKNLVTFGDSYTDESRLGYFFSSPNNTAPPPGTLLPPSNSTAGGGKTWARFVSSLTGAKLYNYAVSGAVCTNSMIYRYLAPIHQTFPDVVYETSAFVADTKYVNASTGTNTLYTNRGRGNTVYSMWIGTNDLGNGAFLTDSVLGGARLGDYVDCVFDRLDEIYKAGGRYFVVMNTVPLELSPLYGMPQVPGTLVASHYWPDKPANTSEVSGKMKQYTSAVNSIYAYRIPYEVVIARRYPGASFALFDTHSLVQDIYAKPEAYLDSPANVSGQYYLCDVATGNVCATQAGTKLSQFLWYDELHPSERVDEVIAKEFVEVTKGKSRYAQYWS